MIKNLLIGAASLLVGAISSASIILYNDYIIFDTAYQQTASMILDDSTNICALPRDLMFDKLSDSFYSEAIGNRYYWISKISGHYDKAW